MGQRRHILIIIAGTVLCILIIILGYFYRSQTAWVESPPYQKSSPHASGTLIAVYSRTGNTLGAAKEVARFFGGDLLEIRAPQYSRDIPGQMLASRHGDDKVTTTPIEHTPVDLGQYDLVFLCAPTWWFRPAPPLWTFVEKHNFKGSAVFLVMTGNSRMKPEMIDEFASLVKEKNARFLDVLFIRRGRIFWQKSPDQVNRQVRRALEQKQDIWHSILRK